MSTRKISRNRPGLTLIEVLVTLILLGILAAIVFPVIVRQIEDAEPTKMANDLTNIKTGIEVFHLNVRPRWPGDLEDLVHQVTAGTDEDIAGDPFGPSHESRWKGPYIDAPIVEDLTDQATGNAILTGFGLFIRNELVCFDPALNSFSTDKTCNTGDFVALLIGQTGDAGITEMTETSQGAEFTALDNLLDDGDGHDLGKVRAAKTDGTALDGVGAPGYIVYLVAPYTGS